MFDSFTSDIYVPAINTFSSLRKVVRSVRLFPTDDAERQAWRLIDQAGLGQDGQIVIGVKRLLNYAEMARQDSNPAEAFVAQLRKHCQSR